MHFLDVSRRGSNNQALVSVMNVLSLDDTYLTVSPINIELPFCVHRRRDAHEGCRDAHVSLTRHSIPKECQPFRRTLPRIPKGQFIAFIYG